jgi:cold shock CspA family protein
VGSGQLKPGRTVIDMSLNALSPSSWSYLRGAQPLIDVRLACDPILGMRQLAHVIRQQLARTTKARARIAQRKQALAERHEALRSRQREAVRKGWDDRPIRPGRLLSEVYDAVKHKHWLLAVRNQSSFTEGIWQFGGAGEYLGHNGGGGVGYGPGAAAGAAIACRDQGRFCVSLMGDGDFVMSAGAIWSAVHNRAPMLIVINNNTTWGNDEKHQIEVAHERRRPVENAWIGQRMVEPDIDHAMTARSFGAWSAGPDLRSGRAPRRARAGRGRGREGLGRGRRGTHPAGLTVSGEVVDFVLNCPIYIVVRDFTCPCYLPARALPKTTLDSDAMLRDVVQLMDADRRFQRRPDMAQGTVKFFNSQKGFGFIQPTDGGQDVFVHISAVERAGMSNLNEGQKLSYEVVSERGKLAASNLQNV